MESAAITSSFNCSVGNVSHVPSMVKRPCIVAVHKVSWSTLSKSHIQGFALGGKLVSYPTKREQMVVSCAKKSDTTVATKSDVPSDSPPQGLQEKKSPRSATFPDGFEALVQEVCDETQIAELKLKVGDFEMHLKRKIGDTSAPVPSSSSATPLPVSSNQINETAPPPKSSTQKISPFTNVPKKSAKLVALEASGSSGYVLVPSPAVGSFRQGRTVKGKKQRPKCSEGDVIREGQVIGFLDQFGSELPVMSDVDGEVLRVLYDDGDAVGYGDPLIAILPSFHGIE